MAVDAAGQGQARLSGLWDLPVGSRGGPGRQEEEYFPLSTVLLRELFLLQVTGVLTYFLEADLQGEGWRAVAVILADPNLGGPPGTRRGSIPAPSLWGQHDPHVLSNEFAFFSQVVLLLYPRALRRVTFAKSTAQMR